MEPSKKKRVRNIAQEKRQCNAKVKRVGRRNKKTEKVARRTSKVKLPIMFIHLGTIQVGTVGVGIVAHWVINYWIPLDLGTSV